MIRLREERQRRGLSQTKLSSMTGIASADISAIENGWKKTFPGWKKRIAKALGIHEAEADQLFEEVLDGDKEMPEGC
ncbi:hypothetical protein JCM14036_02870 [Desulfotomaculum defluvii]